MPVLCKSVLIASYALLSDLVYITVKSNLEILAAC